MLRTHCAKGHEFTEENTYQRPGGGGRQCHTCILDRIRVRNDEDKRVRALNPKPMGPRRKPIGERLWPKVNKNGPLPEHRPDLGPCWLWTGYLNELGYGLISADRTNGGPRLGMERSHRVAYTLEVGPIPEGLELDHLCRVPACCNPAHLEPVTHRENCLRGVSPSAQSARATHCKNGHAFTPDNTYYRNGSRSCRVCVLAGQKAKRNAKRKASVDT